MDYLLTLATIFFAHLLMMISPGPNVLLVSQVAASRSRAAAFRVALGVATGGFTWACLALFGLGVVFEQMVWLYVALKFLGGAYLVFLGVKSWRSADEPLAIGDVEDSVGKPRKSLYLLGLLTNLSNPKSLIFFGGFFAAVIPAAAPSPVKVVAVLLIGFNVVWWHIFVAHAMSNSRVQRGYAAVKTWLDRVVGVVFVAIGLRLAFSQRGF